MKRFLIMAVAGLLAGAARLSAQPAQRPEGAGKRPQRPIVSLNPEEKTAQMVEKYNLTADQQAAVLDLNKRFDGKLDFLPPGRPDRGEEGEEGGERAERKNPRDMTEEEREAFFEQMQDQMLERQEQLLQVQKDQKEYDKVMKGILDKEQYKLYRKDQRKRDQELQRMLQQTGNRAQGGFPGGPGGEGFGGPGGGGFGGPGGGFGGPGGF